MASQLVIFRAFLFIFFRPPTLDLKKNPVNQLIKKFLPDIDLNVIYVIGQDTDDNASDLADRDLPESARGIKRTTTRF